MVFIFQVLLAFRAFSTSKNKYVIVLVINIPIGVTANIFMRNAEHFLASIKSTLHASNLAWFRDWQCLNLAKSYAKCDEIDNGFFSRRKLTSILTLFFMYLLYCLLLEILLAVKIILNNILFHWLFINLLRWILSFKVSMQENCFKIKIKEDRTFLT